MRAGAAVVRESTRFCVRPAVKNHRRSRRTGPPAVYSGVGTSFELLVSPANGVKARQLSFSSDRRNDPSRRLLPDFVIALTTPPLNRPNSAETDEVDTVVSWMASSMKDDPSVVRRRLSWITTPFRSTRFSKELAPEIESACTPFAFDGPERTAPGVRATVASMPRLSGRSFTVSCFSVVAAVAVRFMVSLTAPTT